MDAECLGDEEELASGIGGTLAFDEDMSKLGNIKRDYSTNSMTMPLDLSQKADRPGPCGAHFEIGSATIVKEGRSKYVVYSIVIVCGRGVDNIPAVIDKRYSDFDHLHHSLKKKFAKAMEDIAFPRKVVLGNFKPQTIAQRSRAFEQYLTHLFSIDLLRISIEFANFFYGVHVQDGYQLIKNGQYDEAIGTLQVAVKLQKKLQGDSHSDVVATMSAIVASLAALDRDKQAQMIAEAALEAIEPTNTEEKYLVPLLQLCIRLCWKLGKDKKDLESRLQALRNIGTNVENCPSLLELAVSRF